MQNFKGLNNNHLKQRNRGLVLRMIAGGRYSRTGIAQKIGLSKMSISKIANELIEEGILVEKASALGGAVGRNPLMLDVSPSSPAAVGVYVSRNEICVLICDLKLRTLYEESLALQSSETNASLEEKLFSLLDRAFEYGKRRFPEKKLLGIGISSISPLSPLTGTILRPTNFYGVADYPIAGHVTKRYGIPTFLDNDMNASAVAENIYGIGGSYDAFLYLGITNGVGSGVVLHGELFSNDSISVGEIGHTCINYDGPRCSCGNRGCLELYSDMNVILRRLREETGDPSLTAQDLGRLAKDPGCARILADTTDKLAVALINAVNLFDPQCVVVGHEGAHLPDEYLARLEKTVNRGILASQYKTVRVLRSTFLDRAPRVGSACLVFARLFSGEGFGLIG